MHFPAILDQAARVSAVAKLAPAIATFTQRHPDVALFLIEPKPEDVAVLLTTGFGQASLKEAWNLGVQAANRVLADHMPELAAIFG